MNGKIIIGTELDTKGFDRQIEDLEERLRVIDAQLNAPKTFGLDKTDIQELEIEAEKLTNRLVQLKKQQAEMNTQGLQKISKSISAITKKVGKWALAVFGVRSAYMFVRQAMSTLAQYDKQLATDIEFIRYAVATTLEPVIRFIVQLAYKLLTAINLIWERIFGVSLFSKNLASNFKKAKNQANGLKKTLAGFDEMNTVGSGGMGVNLSPSFDPTKADKGMQDWINKTINKLQNFANKIVAIIPDGIKKGFSNLWQGLIDQIAGVVLVIQGIIQGNWQTVILGIKQFITGAGEIFVGLVNVAKGVVDGIINIFKKIGSGIWNGLVQGAKDAFNGIKSLYNQLPSWFKTLVKGIANTVITVVNSLTSAINIILTPLRAIILAIGKVSGKNWTLDTIKIPKIPKLAKGGIVNLPGKGVPIGGALTGEQRAEGVIPLTDSQQMALLGEAIGKYITINATVVNSMNGRVLSREIQKIQNQSDFLMNR